MDLDIEVLIPLVVLLAILITTVMALICRYYLWKKLFQKQRQYTKVTDGIHKIGGYPKLPVFNKSKEGLISIQQMQSKDQYTNYTDFEKRRKSSKALYYTDANGKSYRYESLSTKDGEEPFYYFSDSRSSKSSGFSDSDMYSELSFQQPTSSEKSTASMGSEKSYPRYNKLLQHRSRFLSEPDLAVDDKESSLVARRKKFQKNNTKRRTSSALSIISPAGGQIEFGLYYDIESRSLDITVSQLLDLTLKPENFLSLLSTYEKHERPKSNKVHLIRDVDGSIELSDYSNLAFLVYISLLPKRTFNRHTNVVFGTGNVVFNEKFSITGCTTEQLSSCYLCFHALCKFGRDGEPIVLGEVKVPLKRIQVAQNLPFMANLGPPEEVLEVENYLKPSTDLGYLDIHLSFNPLGQKLVVKILQAIGLPKIGMTGHPNVSIKTSLFYCNTRIAKRSSVIKKRARDPIYSDTFEFDVSKDRLNECDVLFEIRHHGPMYRTVIGYVTVGYSAGGEGEKHWRAALLDLSYHEKRHKIMSHKPVALL